MSDILDSNAHPFNHILFFQITTIQPPFNQSGTLSSESHPLSPACQTHFVFPSLFFISQISCSLTLLPCLLTSFCSLQCLTCVGYLPSPSSSLCLSTLHILPERSHLLPQLYILCISWCFLKVYLQPDISLKFRRSHITNCLLEIPISTCKLTLSKLS